MSNVYFYELAKIVGRSTHLKRTFAGIVAQASYAIAGTKAGGLTMGPLGALIGGIMGAVYGYSNTADYDNIVVAFRALSEKEQAEVLRLLGYASVEELMRYLSTGAPRQTILDVLSNYVHQNKRS
ncbi:hypothetical protein GCK32_018167 [Trichostrongylus colubriformis]|uniref:Uncharacterized protein n=1 Tax=Trichostrongylus colubriformis TaxID=6319 RepID=A0AAN8FYU8_TRICO